MFNYNNYKNIINKSIKDNLIKKYEKYDYKIFKNRNKKRYIIKKRRKRTIITEYGYITYNRRIYWDNYLKKYKIFTDDYIGINKNQRVINNLKELIIKEASSGNRYQDIKDIIKINISLMTISNILKNANLQEIKINNKIKVKDNEYIYINTDDCFQYLKNKNNKKELFKIRIISFNTGIDYKNSKYKNKLKNKKINFIYNDKYNYQNYYENNKLVDYIWKKLNEYYEFENAKIIVGGDGAIWIRNLAKELGANYIFDKFHALRYLWAAYKPNIEKRKLKLVRENFINYQKAKEYFIKGQYDNLINFLETTKIDSQTLFVFKKNKDGVVNQKENWNIGVSAESDVFHLVKSLKGNGSKIYNYKTFQNMLIARTNLINSKI